MSVFLSACAAQPLIASCAEAVGRSLLLAHGAALRTKCAITHKHDK